MKTRRLRANNQGSIYPVLILFLLIAIVSLVVLILDEMYTPFYQLTNSHDTDLDPAFSAPVNAGAAFINLMWPKGLIIIIFVIIIAWMLMEYNKKNYPGGG